MEQPNKHPKVSVIIPIYNTCHYVQEALESICRQTLTELEIIAIDDGSTDSSRKVVEQVAATDMRIRVYSQANQGIQSGQPGAKHHPEQRDAICPGEVRLLYGQ